ncbi:TOBE domain-containing protein [Natronosalvus rutilus]|uniref:TOBE domain-containing protein n=1 Tax=Natronosalvus rutilus TaxID=2953753 RepID=A0A9E7N939_9EURY|nr:TOBE domain-containing protein [Natronosalvus rutilus]UTF53106.1 TOBE domain-containing protein [Natronosalvus rutilus]
MTIERGYRTELTVGEVTVGRRDVEMLEAIDAHGSMHAAADALGRSYARLQRRIVELEDELGPLTERHRGGADGGGTTITETAQDLRRRFERHQTALEGVASVTESVLSGTVVDREGELATVETDIGLVVAVAPQEAEMVQVSVRSDAVVLSDPGERSQPGQTSFRNRFEGTVERVEQGTSVAQVRVGVDGTQGRMGADGAALKGPRTDEAALEALVTRASVDSLGLEPGRPIVASFKATAARAIPLEGVDGSPADSH